MIARTGKLTVLANSWVESYPHELYDRKVVRRPMACVDGMANQWNIKLSDTIWIVVSDEPVQGAIKIHRRSKYYWTSEVRIANRHCDIYCKFADFLQNRFMYCEDVWVWVEVAT